MPAINMSSSTIAGTAPRDANGFITADPQRFPSGIKALADYVHSRGLKFGIYSDAGRLTCGGRPGSQGHEYQDALTYARWGVDYLKYDWCSTGDRNAQEAYAVMADALRASGRDIVFSMCEWGTAKPWLWAKNTGNLWRTTGDIWDSFATKDKAHDWAHPVLEIVDLNEPLWPFAGPGHWNDRRHARGRQWRHDAGRISLAFLAVGDDGLAADGRQRHRAHGRNDAIDPAQQGSDRGRPGPARACRAIACAKDGDREVWVKPLAGGARALLLFNRGETPATIRATAEQLGWPPELRARVRDLWAHRDAAALVGVDRRRPSSRTASRCSGSSLSRAL